MRCRMSAWVKSRHVQRKMSVRDKELRSARAVVTPPITAEATMARGALLWLLGVPIPIIILLFLFWH